MIRVQYKKIKLWIWRIVYAPIYMFRYWKCRTKRRQFLILNSRDTVNYIKKYRCSVSRYGDGELAMIYHYLGKGKASDFYIQAFQQYEERLAKRLYEILVTESEDVNHKIAIPYGIVSVDDYIGLEKIFWQRFVVLDIDRFSQLFRNKVPYLNSCFTRFYMGHRQCDVEKYITLMKEIWEKQNICIVEGTNSRLGVGNDLFENAKSISRILCPPTNAFSIYDDIFASIKQYTKFDLYLIALGHTATVLTFDLAKIGLWAVDIGHVDIEYEWFRMKVKKKVAISNKYVNEVPDGRVLTETSDQKYLSQIILRLY